MIGSKVRNQQPLFRYLTPREGTETASPSWLSKSIRMVHIPYSPRGDGNLALSECSCQCSHSNTLFPARGRKHPHIRSNDPKCVRSDTLLPARGRKLNCFFKFNCFHHLFRHLTPREGTKTFSPNMFNLLISPFRHLTSREGTETSKAYCDCGFFNI